jgi:hypothetical protein
MPTKLHELLAVYTSVTGQATKLRGDLSNLFEKKSHHFRRTIKTFHSLTENEPPKVEDQQDIQTTVGEEIKWIRPKLTQQVDVNYQIDCGNKEAKADLVTENGETLLRDLPTTTLLWLEKRVAEWKDLIAAIPTLDPAKGFQPDAAQGPDIFMAREVTKPRTRKGKKLYIKYEATDKHPAQTELIDEDIPVGTTTDQEWSSLITPAKKAELLDQAEILSRAVSRARAKANEHAIEVKEMKIGDTLLDFVFKPLST